jgi:hypothetical protein
MGEPAKQTGLAALIREPLLHYLLLGLIAFGLYSYLGEGNTVYEPPDRVIQVSAERVRSLGAVWEKKRNRPPTEAEFRGMIEAIVREEIFSREAIALKLDRDDTIVRRRLAQKLEYLIRDLAPPPEPTEAELREFIDSEGDRYHQPAKIAFTHVYFSADKRGDRIDADAEAALARLRAEPDLDPAEFGDVIMLEPDQRLERLPEIERRFGPDFAKAIEGCTPDKWEGPVLSAYGLHLVLVIERMAGGAPGLDDVREVVRRDLMVVRRDMARTAFYEALRKQYKIEVDEEAVKATVLETRENGPK